MRGQKCRLLDLHLVVDARVHSKLFFRFFLGLHLAFLVDQDGRWFGIGMVSRVLPQFGSVFR